MKYPKETRTYCPSCRKHTLHKVKLESKGKGRGRTMAKGTKKHERIMKGYGGKRKGNPAIKKQGKRQKIILTCSVCNKKHQRIIGTRTKKKLEITAK